MFKTSAINVLPSPCGLRCIPSRASARRQPRPVPAAQESASLMETGGANLETMACIERARDGDQAAARELIERIYPLVIRIARRNLPRRDAEEDLAQEILSRVFAHLDSFRNTAPLEHWVSRIAVNVCMNRLRAEKSRPELRWADLPEAQADALDAVAAGRELLPGEELSARDLAEHLLAALSPEDSLVMRMLEMEGLTVKEASARTGWSGAAIRVRAFRARQKLNRKFARLWEKQKI